MTSVGSRIRLTIFLVISGCTDNQYVMIEPPSSPKEAEIWWTGIVDHFDPNFLAVLCAVSDVHKENGTSATYVRSITQRNLAGTYHSEGRLPLPLSDEIREKARVVVENWAFDKPSGTGSSEWHWEAGKGCSVERAEEIWREAEKKLGWR